MTRDCGIIKTSRQSVISTLPALTNSTVEVLNMAKASLPNSTKPIKTCYAPDCERPTDKKGLCNMHYRRVQKHGTVSPPPSVAIQAPPDVRFWRQVDKSGDCWLWRGKARPYGMINIGRKSIRAHRYSYFLANGHWPEPECLHSCDNKRCVNPAHLSAGTHAQNMREAAERGRLPSIEGEANPNAKMTVEQVKEIRKRLKAGERVCNISRALQISANTIDHIKHGRHWKSVT